MRIGILGANGQVGAEICLLLAQHGTVDVVPICRSRLGSAYLRYNGLACRHGEVADPCQAANLLGDCDVVADFSLASLSPDYSQAKKIHNQLIRNVAKYTKPGAKYIYFSTQSVYGEPRINQHVVFRDLYGYEKLRCEKLVRRYALCFDCEPYIFRLGHVCGELQGITAAIRDFIISGPVPEIDWASNTVHVVTIIDAILNVAHGKVRPDIYDLMNVPQWSWREVFEYEANRVKIKPTFKKYVESRGNGIVSACRHIASKIIHDVTRSREGRKLSSRLYPIIPKKLGRKIRADYLEKSALNQVSELNHERELLDAFFFKAVGKKMLGILSPTAELLSSGTYELYEYGNKNSWPKDLPMVVDDPND